MPPNPETLKSTAPETPSTPKEQLDELRKSNDKSSWNILEKFNELVANIKEKGFLEAVFGPWLAILSALKKPESPDKPNEPETQKPAEAPRAPEIQTQLGELVAENAGISKLDHTVLKSEKYDTVTNIDKKTEKKTITTLCSGTALKNLYKLGCRHIFSAATAVEDLIKDPNKKFEGLPSGDAYKVRSFYNMSRYHFKIPGGLNAKENRNLVPHLDASGMNVADVLVRTGSDYDHRATAFKSLVDGRWYVLDPYMHAGAGEIKTLNEKITLIDKQIDDALRAKQDEKASQLKSEKEANLKQLDIVMNKIKEPIPLEQYFGNIEYVVPMKQDAESALAYIPPTTKNANS